jgi:guanine nucleotide-binding protein alpha-1 subunit
VVIETITDAHRSILLSDDDDSDAETDAVLAPELESLATRLLPLRHIENLLIAKLVPPNEHEATHLGSRAESINSQMQRRYGQEIFVRPGEGLHGALLKSHRLGRPMSAGNTGIETQDEPQTVLHSCRHDIMSLLQNPTVNKILKRRKVRLEELPGLYVLLHSRHCVVLIDAFSYLNDLERLTSLRYMPNDGTFV